LGGPLEARRVANACRAPGKVGEHLGRSTRFHRDAIEHVGRLHRALLVADDEQLRLSPELVDQPEEAVQVDVVERGLDLVHHVEGRRPAAEHGEEEGQGGEAALAARQQRQLLHVLAAGLGLDLDAGVQQVVGVGERPSDPSPPGNSVENSASKCPATSA
jgi:hypothetical protein